MGSRRFHRLGRPALTFVALLGLIGGPNGAYADPATDAAKADGKAFGTIGNDKVLGAAHTQPTADVVPNFTTNPSQKVYYSNPNSLAPSAAALAPGNAGYQQVNTSLTSRPQIPQQQVKDTIARGKIVADSPATYTSGFGANGTRGSCHPLPSTPSSPGTYEQSCNQGFVSGATNQTCPVRVNHTITATTIYHYLCTEGDYQSNKTDSCSIYPDGVCKVVRTIPGKCLQGNKQFCTEPGDPISVLECGSLIPGGSLKGTSTKELDNRTIDASACATLSANTQCTQGVDTCIDSTPATRTISGVPITEACWGWSRAYTCTGLTPAEDCSKLPKGCVFEKTTCISPQQAPCLTTDNVYRCPLPSQPGQQQSICDGDVYCLNGSCDTITRTPDADFSKAVVALNAINQAGKEFYPKNLILFKGTRLTCSKTIFGLSNCCALQGFPIFGGCNGEDQQLHKQREKGLCHRVGSYCSSDFLGICLELKDAHCCFLSKISRILQEQGRPQINKPWANPQDEKCPGFTIDEFQRLDLSKMDFSEVYAEFTAAAKLPNELQAANDLKAKIQNYYANHH